MQPLYRVPYQFDLFDKSPPPPVEVEIPDWLRERYAGISFSLNPIKGND